VNRRDASPTREHARSHWSRWLEICDVERPGARKRLIWIALAMSALGGVLRVLFVLALWCVGARAAETDVRRMAYPALFVFAFALAAQGRDMRAVAILAVVLLPLVFVLDPLLQLARMFWPN
jgi:hypothetical protein